MNYVDHVANHKQAAAIATARTRAMYGDNADRSGMAQGYWLRVYDTVLTYKLLNLDSEVITRKLDDLEKEDLE